jgi:hypothetical protein
MTEYPEVTELIEPELLPLVWSQSQSQRPLELLELEPE